MAYIQPNSTIEFFGDINLSDKYSDSLYFASVSAKDTYFTNLTKLARVLTCTYTRENRGFVRVEVPMSTLIGATYMRFKNTSFENKWFYAFVRKVNYINNQTTEVEFAIDPLMTWMGTFTLNECFIERQHTVRDGIGNNIADEGLPVGEYVCEGTYFDTLGINRIVLVYIPNNPDDVTGRIVGGTYSGCNVREYSFTAQGASELNELLRAMVRHNLIDNVVGIYICPSEVVNSPNGQGGKTVSFPKPYDSINGYVPRNNKLFCFPYKYLLVDNSEGESKEYLYEYFNTLPDATSSGNCEFAVNWVYNSRCEIMTAPINYKSTMENTDVGSVERITMSHFPVGSFGINSYEAYLAQKNAYYTQNVMKGGVKGMAAGGVGLAGKMGKQTFGTADWGDGSIGIAGTVGGILGGIAGIFSTVADHFIENGIKPTTPMEMRGDPCGDVMNAISRKRFSYMGMCITKNYAMMLDSYFDMFGYAVKQHGVPNMNARPNWTFVKTIGCNVGGNIPADDATVIETIFDNGIRFWKNHNNIGNYSLNNAPE